MTASSPSTYGPLWSASTTHSAKTLLPTSSSPRVRSTTLENASSLTADSLASAGNPDTEANGDQPTTSLVHNLVRSSAVSPNSASRAFNSTSLRDPLIIHPSVRRHGPALEVIQVPRTFAFAAANSSSDKTPEECS